MSLVRLAKDINAGLIHIKFVNPAHHQLNYRKGIVDNHNLAAGWVALNNSHINCFREWLRIEKGGIGEKWGQD